MRYTLFALAFFCLNQLIAQDRNLYPTNGAKNQSDTYYAFTNATLHLGQSISSKGTLLVRNGKFVKVGTVLSLPKGTVIVDLKGKHIYPSFIDIYSDYGQPKTKPKSTGYGPQLESRKKGAFGWNESVKPEYSTAKHFTTNEKKAKELREMGFGTVLSHKKDGIVRGTSSLVTLNQGTEREIIIKPEVATHFSFSKGSSKQSYPSSLMGIIALLRQTFYDGIYYQNKKDDLPLDLSLDAFQEGIQLPKIFEANDKLNILRADAIGDEFGYQFIFKGAGDEYQRMSEIKATGGSIIVPINFPKPFDVSDPYAARFISLTQMKHWELAPSNPALLVKGGVEFAITTDGIKKKSEFLSNIKKAMAQGLTESDALAALTTIPAKMIGAQDLIGGLRVGMYANFLVTSGKLFEKETVLYSNWIQGKKFLINSEDLIDVRGSYKLKVAENDRSLIVAGSRVKPTASIEYNFVVDSVDKNGDLVLNEGTNKPIKVAKRKKVKALISVKDKQVALSYKLMDAFYSLAGTIHSNSGLWEGNGTLPDGSWAMWAAIKTDDYKEKNTKVTETLKLDTSKTGAITFPLMAYGLDSLPDLRHVLIKDATIWTNEAEGVLEGMDILLQDGKIKAIGEVLDVVDASTIVINGKGKHVTAGIIDEHSHIAVSRGVNESGQASSAEVSIASVVNSDDINIYRQLAGGVTTSQLLHGSANPIGGQSAIIKLKWGWTPEEMKYKNMPLFIKFALGENVKQSNWGAYNTVRFPQTRMGVEQVYYDHFLRAKAYDVKWSEYNSLKPSKKNDVITVPPRRDLELETLAQILNKERYISCHSYVQSEINMLMKVADSMGFTLNTFTHILEGYKVADKMKAHGAGGSTFSDWWAYKYEVRDAIPHNASLLNEMGVITAVNSDDAEMARRLNQEAAKGIKYGGMSEEDALKMVTLNPAKLLHIDDRVGSLKAGKDADVVVWSKHPLSIYAKPEQTIVDGYILFDKNMDKLQRSKIASERTRLIAKMLKAKLGGEETQPIKEKKNRIHNCNVFSDDGN